VAAVLALLSSLTWGSADFVAGVASRTRSAWAVLAGSQLIGLVAVLIAATAAGTWRADIGWLPWGLFAGTTGCIGLICFYTALATGTMGVVSPIASTGVVVPIVFGFASGDSPSGAQLTGIALALVGVVAASRPELSGDTGRRPVLLAVVAGAMFGLVFVGLDQGSDSSPLMTLVGMRLASCGALLAAAAIFRTTAGLRVADVPVLAVVGLGDAGANLMFGLATTGGLVSIVSVLGALYPVVTVLLARLVLAERLRLIQTLGVAVALTGVVLISAG
jgi:drug/metabolite transporter (DMT)-like permease